MSLYSLYSDDIRTATTDASADMAFDIVHISLIAIFLVEITFNWLTDMDYRWSFYFYLDVISSLSMLLDVSMLTQLNAYNCHNLETLLVTT